MEKGLWIQITALVNEEIVKQHKSSESIRTMIPPDQVFGLQIVDSVRSKATFTIRTSRCIFFPQPGLLILRIASICDRRYGTSINAAVHQIDFPNKLKTVRQRIRPELWSEKQHVLKCQNVSHLLGVSNTGKKNRFVKIESDQTLHHVNGALKQIGCSCGKSLLES